MRFLVVDDDPAIRFFVREALLGLGAEQAIEAGLKEKADEFQRAGGSIYLEATP